MKVLYAAAIGIYVFLFACLVAVLVTLSDDEDTMLMALYALSTSMMLFTVIFAVLFLRGSTTDKYKEYIEQKQAEEANWEKKE